MGASSHPGQLDQLLRDQPGWELAADGRRIVRSLAFPSGISSLLFTFIILELATETGGVPVVDVRNETLLARCLPGLLPPLTAAERRPSRRSTGKPGGQARRVPFPFAIQPIGFPAFPLAG